jgi:hypothetical protein
MQQVKKSVHEKHTRECSAGVHGAIGDKGSRARDVRLKGLSDESTTGNGRAKTGREEVAQFK